MSNYLTSNKNKQNRNSHCMMKDDGDALQISYIYLILWVRVFHFKMFKFLCWNWNIFTVYTRTQICARKFVGQTRTSTLWTPSTMFLSFLQIRQHTGSRWEDLETATLEWDAFDRMSLVLGATSSCPSSCSADASAAWRKGASRNVHITTLYAHPLKLITCNKHGTWDWGYNGTEQKLLKVILLWFYTICKLWTFGGGG